MLIGPEWKDKGLEIYLFLPIYRDYRHLLAELHICLENAGNHYIVDIMNAAEIIQEIERLPESEKGKVVEFVEAIKGSKSVRYIDSALVEKTADKVFREHAPLFEKLAQ